MFILKLSQPTGLRCLMKPQFVACTQVKKCSHMLSGYEPRGTSTCLLWMEIRKAGRTWMPAGSPTRAMGKFYFFYLHDCTFKFYKAHALEMRGKINLRATLDAKVSPRCVQVICGQRLYAFMLWGPQRAPHTVALIKQSTNCSSQLFKEERWERTKIRNYFSGPSLGYNLQREDLFGKS